MRHLALILSAVLLMAQAPAPAPAPDRPLADPAAETRARDLFQDIRCVVCQHESIADSPAGIAADLRQVVREEIAAGATDAEIRSRLVDRYGDYILFRPPFDPSTLILWLAPFALAIGAAGVFLARRRPTEAVPLSAGEERRLAELLGEGVRPDLDANPAQDPPTT